MADLTGSEILAKSLKNEGTDILFFLMGGPMLLAESSCIKEGIRPLDVRHEQSAAFMGQAYSRLLQKPSVCMAASGPGVINLTTGIANALIDCCPVVAVGGSSPISQNGRQVFQAPGIGQAIQVHQELHLWALNDVLNQVRADEPGAPRNKEFHRAAPFNGV